MSDYVMGLREKRSRTWKWVSWP